MKKFYVSASLYYEYTIEVPDDFDLKDKIALMELAADADPLLVNANKVENPEVDFRSIIDEQGNNLYDWG